MKTKPKFSGPELCRLEAHTVVSMLRAGDVSTAELIDAAMLRISKTGPFINATPTLCKERALGVTLNLNENDHAGWLAGLPISIKDLNTVAGVRTTFGTKGFADFIPEESDPLVERLEARGGVVLG